VRLLVVEDEDAIAGPLVEGLQREGFAVERAATGEAALAAEAPDLVLLDLRLPDLDGLEVCRRLRERSRVPIIVVSARGEEVDRVVGLELGADDYVVKPFGLRELIARIKAVLRRAEPAPASGATRVADLEVDTRARRATLNGTDVALTPKEFDLLLAFVRRPGVVLSRVALLRDVWGHSADVLTRTVDIHVAELRRKLESDPSTPKHILTVWKAGYRLHR